MAGPTAVRDGLLNRVADVQATVASYDAQTRGGTVVLDDGVLREFGAAALDESRLRLLRPGQRVRLTVDEDGAIVSMQILTLSG